MTKVRLRMTVICEYDADPEDYDTGDPRLMAEIDYDNVTHDQGILLDVVRDDRVAVTLVPVEAP